ncbi:MAG: cupin domain-containing protein [Pyrinomonadaceae bacterium]
MLINNRQESNLIATPHNSEIHPLMDATNSSITRCSLAEETLPPGAAVYLHKHQYTEEIYYILSGSGLMTIGDEQRTVGPGDAIYIPAQSFHSIKNVGLEPMTILLVCGPAYSPEDHLPWVPAQTD